LFEHRITKYNPNFRRADGAYTRDEWTEFTDIGHSFGGVVLTLEEYQRVEAAYVTTALAFLGEAGVSSLVVVGLENAGGGQGVPADGAGISRGQLGPVIERVLRGEFWCKLESPEAFIHIGWDYYMYVGVPRRCPKAARHARKLGLFVEELGSPYREDARG
jgi:hypothetical protein